MRCLHCHHEGVTPDTELCPSCGVYLPSLLRDVLSQGTILRANTYRIEYALGRGSFGITYLARHCTLDHLVAIKEFFPKDYASRNHATGELIIPVNQQEAFQKGLKRFLGEGRILVKLDHNNVVKVQDLFEENNTAYIVMDFIEGKTLAMELECQSNKKLSPIRVEVLMEQLVSAITAVHQAQIYHLDLKPENILITSEDQVVLVDFGAAKHIAGQTINRTRFFTQSYAAPEIVIGGEIGPQSDLFELGMILYEMLTGTLPTPGLTRLVEGDHWIPERLEEPWISLVLSALRLKREERPSSILQWWGSRKKPSPEFYHYCPVRKPDSPYVKTLRGYFVLPFLREQGYQQRFGRGRIRSVFPLSDNLVVVCSAAGATLFHFDSGQSLWEIDCPSQLGVLSPDGNKLALVWQQRIYLWNLETGRLLQTLEGHLKAINCITFSADGNWLVSGSKDETLIVWDVTEGKARHQLDGHEWYVTCVAVSSDNQWIASGSLDQTLRLWDLASGEMIRVLQAHENGIDALAFSHDSLLLASGSRDSTVKVWDVSSGEVLQEFTPHTDWITSIAFSPDNSLLAASTGVDDKGIWVWNVANGEEIWQLEGHWNTVKAIAFCPDERYLLSGGYDYTLRLWDLVDGQQVKKLKKHTNWVYCVACSPDNRLIATGGNDQLIRLWDTVENKQINVLVGHTDIISSLMFSEDGKFLISGSWDKTVRLWEIASGKQIRCLQGHQDFISSVAFSRSGKYIASGSWDQTVRIWDLSASWLPLGAKKTVRILCGHTEEVEGVAFSYDSMLVASGGQDKVVRVWEVASGQEIHRLEGHNWSVQCLSFHPHGNLLASGGKDYQVHIWELETWKTLHKLKGHTHFVNSLAFSPNGKFIVSGSHDQTVRLWDVATGELIQVWQGHTGYVKSVTFSGDGSFVVSSDTHGVVRLWRV